MSNVIPTPRERRCKDGRANPHKSFNQDGLQAGELGFEPSFLRSTPHRRDTALRLQNYKLQAFTIDPAPVYIIAALG